MIQKILYRLKSLNIILTDFEHRQRLSADRLDDTYSMQLLQGLLTVGHQLPATSSSLKFRSLAVLVNDIIINSRHRIVEFGSGISTIVFARLFKRNNIDARIFSIDESGEWIAIIKGILEQEDLLHYVTFIEAPLVPSERALGDHLWYSETALEDTLGAVTAIDLVLVDGPSAWHKEIEMARYPALPCLINKLGEKFSFYLDDANRNGEAHILSKWEQEYSLEFSMINNSLAFAKKGSWFNTKI